MNSVRFVDGTEALLQELDWNCEERDNSGRHFTGNGTVICDLTDDTRVIPEHRKVWETKVFFEGDWGADFSEAEWRDVTPVEYHQFKVEVGDRWDDGHGKYDIFTVRTNVSIDIIKEAIRLSIEAMPALHDTCSNYEDSKCPLEVLEALPNIGINFADYSEDDETIMDPEHFVRFMLDIASVYTPFTYEIIEDHLPTVNLQSSGYGLFS